MRLSRIRKRSGGRRRRAAISATAILRGKQSEQKEKLGKADSAVYIEYE